MDEKEIQQILAKMDCIKEGEYVLPSGTQVTQHYERGKLMQDAIVLNRFAVEVLQLIDRDKTRFQAVVTANDDGVFFGFSVATAAWSRFALADKQGNGYQLHEPYEINVKENVLIAVESTDDADMVKGLIELIEAQGAKPVGIVTLFANEKPEFDLPTFTLVD